MTRTMKQNPGNNREVWRRRNRVPSGDPASRAVDCARPLGSDDRRGPDAPGSDATPGNPSFFGSPSVPASPSVPGDPSALDDPSEPSASPLGDPSPDEPGLFDYRRNALSETIITTIVAFLVLILLYSLLSDGDTMLVTALSTAGLVTVAFATIRYTLSPDRLRAVQTKRTLKLASCTLEYMRGGLSSENCQEVCRILLPESQAMAVAMTDDKVVLGYAGRYVESFPIGSPIHTEATHRVLASQQLEVFNGAGALGMGMLSTPDGKAAKSPRYPKGPRHPKGAKARKGPVGRKSPNVPDPAPHPDHSLRPDPAAAAPSAAPCPARSHGSRAPQSPQQPFIPAGIVAPLVVRGVSVGTLKLYFEAPHLVDETQRAIAEGLAQLLSTQLSIAELDRQVELATKAELQALQSQINPHFLFNTINTIAALIRIDPTRARSLLREFAVFYRQTLENSSDLIPLEREIQQTSRYLSFEVARFGDERIDTVVTLTPGLEGLRVPSFLIQPVVENSVNHAMRPEGTLHIAVDAYPSGNDVLIRVADDGVGMTGDLAARLLQEAGPSESGTGIALRNVNGRLHAVFGPGSGVSVESEVGVGTTVTLRLADALPEGWPESQITAATELAGPAGPAKSADPADPAEPGAPSGKPAPNPSAAGLSASAPAPVVGSGLASNLGDDLAGVFEDDFGDDFPEDDEEDDDEGEDGGFSGDDFPGDAGFPGDDGFLDDDYADDDEDASYADYAGPADPAGPAARPR